MEDDEEVQQRKPPITILEQLPPPPPDEGAPVPMEYHPELDAAVSKSGAGPADHSSLSVPRPRSNVKAMARKDHVELDTANRFIDACHLAPPPPRELPEPMEAAVLLEDCLELDTAKSFVPEPSRDPPPRLQDKQHVVLDLTNVEEWMNGMLPPNYESEPAPTIYRVPQELRGGSEDAYLPFAVMIGPLAHNRQGDYGYERLQGYKWCCVRRLISRHRLLQEHERTPVLLHRCLNSLSNLEPRIRASYPRDLKPESFPTGPNLHLCMLLDGCFILHRLLKYARIAKREEAADARTNNQGKGKEEEEEEEEEEEDDDWTQVFVRCWVWGFVTYDLLLLENQIPFFVVQSLFHELRTDPDESSDILVAGALRLFRSIQPQPLQSFSHIACRNNVHHLLHLFYLSVGLPVMTPEPDYPSRDRYRRMPASELSQWMPCARELEEAGVKIRPARQSQKQGASSSSFLDVRFDAGVLEVPMLQLYDYSEQLLRNLIAFEQTYPRTPGHVTAYAMFMDCLVASPEDVRLLQLRGVLVNQMNGVPDRDGTGLFGRVCQQVHMAADRNYLAGVIAEVNKYQRARWPRWRAALMRSYFSNPWVATSLAAAVLLLALTILQSFFAAYSYFKPPKP